VTLAPGDPLPDVPLVRPDGGRASLADLRDRASLLVFLRHLA
jgi:peroxiredoxin